MRPIDADELKRHLREEMNFFPVKLGSTVYVIRRKKASPVEVAFVGFGADGTFVFNAFNKGNADSFATYQFDGSDIGKIVFLTKKEAEKAMAKIA